MARQVSLPLFFLQEIHGLHVFPPGKKSGIAELLQNYEVLQQPLISGVPLFYSNPSLLMQI